MTDFQLQKEINSLPDDLKKEVTDFVAFLKNKSGPAKKIKQRKFGYAKGFFKMSKDFDAPLDDFKDYM
jgi:argonaute-like protein implicated in RNA metabolism and viral defense